MNVKKLEEFIDGWLDDYRGFFEVPESTELTEDFSFYIEEDKKRPDVLIIHAVYK